MPMNLFSVTYTLSKGLALLQGQRVRLGNDGDNIDNLREFLEHNNVDGFEPNMKCIRESLLIYKDNLRMTRGGNEKQTAMDTRVGDVAITLCREFFAEIG